MHKDDTEAKYIVYFPLTNESNANMVKLKWIKRNNLAVLTKKILVAENMIAYLVSKSKFVFIFEKKV